MNLHGIHIVIVEMGIMQDIERRITYLFVYSKYTKLWQGTRRFGMILKKIVQPKFFQKEFPCFPIDP